MSSTADQSIDFDERGVCNHCIRYDELLSSRVFRGSEADAALALMVKQIKSAGKNSEYDCLIGVSGGVDSTYVAYLTKKLGLRPLAVHFDNGWNSELAVNNIQQVLEKLDIDLYTYVVDWNEFRDIQLSFLKASTPDGEVPTDHAIGALLWKQALKHKIKYIVTGMNFATESISVPAWAYGHSDWRYIKSVHKKYGTIPLKTYPHFGLGFLMYINILRGVRSVSILNYIDYNKKSVMDVLENELGWKKYEGKHHESIYTRFFQGHILPNKFGIDKRYGHLSDLINSGQLDRETALLEVQSEPYPIATQQQDIEYACKKFNITRQAFDDIMKLPSRTFRDYPNSYSIVQFLRRTVNRLRKLGVYPK